MTLFGVPAEQFPAESMPAEVTTYVGRRSEIAEVRKLLGTASLVSLIGPGGVGKTRLALRVIAAARASFSDDVVFVGLAELRDPTLLVNTVADRLGFGDRSARPRIELLVDQLRTRRLLLVLDNCEHLVEACARLVGALQAACPDVVVLVTSRQSLGVSGEHIVPISPMAVPESGVSRAALEQYDAVRLLADRATAVLPSFAITDGNVADVTRLCQVLDGLPLAIELAAVRLRSLSVRQVADRLTTRFTLLTGGRRRGPSRHATFQALIDWSYELCTERERLLWARASVFAASFVLDAAEDVCSGEGLDRHAVLDVLDGLIDKSILLREEHQGVARYRMLETVRQYGEERLLAADDLVRMRRRHRDWCHELTAQFADDWLGPNQVAWVDRLKLEHANLRAALEFCVSEPGEAVVGLHMAHAVKEHWVQRGITEGRFWLGKLLDAAPADSPGRAGALWIDAFLALVQSDRSAYQSSLAKAIQAAEETGDEHARAYVDHVRGYAALIGNEGERSATLFHAAAAKFRATRDPGGELWSTYNYGLALSLAGDLDRAREVLRDCIRTCESTGEVFWRCWALWSRSAAEYLFGDMHAAQDAGLELLRLQRRINDRAIIAFALTVMAGCATHLGELVRAARLLGAASTVWQSIGASLDRYVAFADPMRRDIELVTGELGIEAAAGEFTVGAAMSRDEAVAYALGEVREGGKGGDIPPRAPSTPLTKRETEIAELVAMGMTNREIAERLVIARRTAETHVDHIMTKLNFSSRAQIAAWVVESRRTDPSTMRK